MAEKPLVMRRDECLEGIVSAVNASRLPAFMVVDILERVLYEARGLARQETARAVEQYQQRLHEEAETTKEDA